MKTAKHEPRRGNSSSLRRRERRVNGPPSTMRTVRNWTRRAAACHAKSMQDARALEGGNKASSIVTSGLDPIEGEAVFMSAEAKTQRTTELLGDGALVVEVAPPGHGMRARLAELIDEVIERE